MDAVGALSFLLIAIAALAALCGYVAGAVRERNRRRAGRYFAIGVAAGFLGASVMRYRLGRSALGTVARRFVLPQRLDNPIALAALQLRRSLSRVGITR
ncbi:hypothetical protein ORI20_29030 [Mycobacterium sp. CVI_P3]|uniref:Uncharacterized protein n=1 Tax=Mycobacterium pinniadriaticum TaxID=2994102 RepID=A0ABT3SNJ3_9MYCO|nr:hypothetical protein [Mycobacterium pinniadriaticum]MCX2934315.1 hypothetical protein [Mycobacterium pinniadriaticum]MCX2940738.1 hypothetical protein [Mycobacterium pinniadriaticum]